MSSDRGGHRPADPKQYRFSEGDRSKYGDRFWKMPRRLVTEGNWASLWRADGTKRGGGIATSILPVLALHTWPGKKNIEGSAGSEETNPTWTGWTYLSRRRVARVAGVDKDAATSALQRLISTGLVQLRRVPREKYEGGYKTYYRLSGELYPRDKGDAYAQIFGNLFYGGTWSLLPTAAARHLYAVLACLDPIDDESAYLDKIEADLPDGQWIDLDDSRDVWNHLYPQLPAGLTDEQRFDLWVSAIKAETLARRRRQAPKSLTELQEISAMSRGTVTEALQVLTKPIFGDRRDKETGAWTPPIPLVAKGQQEPRRPTWYAPDRRARHWYWYPDVLNDQERVSQTRAQLWPELPARRARVGMVLKRLSAAEDLSAWQEALDLRALRDRREGVGLSSSPVELARIVRRGTSRVEQSLRIADRLTSAVLEQSGVSAGSLALLSRSALLRAARGEGSDRVRTLQEECRRAELRRHG